MTKKELERRIVALEAEVASLRTQVPKPTVITLSGDQIPPSTARAVQRALAHQKRLQGGKELGLA